MADQPARVIAPEDESPTFAGRMAPGLALFVLLAVTLIQIYRVGAADETRVKSFAYTQDAAYQHLVIGRELVKGTTTTGPRHFRQGTPLAASASPGWSVTMAVLLGLPSLSSGQAGRNLDQIALVPLGVNIVAAALLIAVAGHLVSRDVRSGLWMFAFLVGLGVLVALPLMAMTGMEHLAHMVIVLLSVAVGLRSVDRPDASVALILLAAVLTAISVSLRFESLAVMLALFLWAWIQRRMGRKVPSMLAGIGLVVALGAYLARHGASAVPNPVLVHAGMLFGGHWSAWAKMLFEHAVLNLHAATLPWVLVLMGAVLLAACRGWTHSSDPLGRRNVGWLFVFVFAGLAHMLVGQADEQSMRYTAYLIPLGAVAIARSMGLIARTGWLVTAVPAVAASSERAALVSPSTRPWVRGNGLIAIVCLLPMLLAAVPAIRGFVNAPQVARDAYVRERLAASFVRTFWSEGPVATNETGAIGYETKAALVDLSGWTDHAIAKARFDGTYDRELIAREVAESQAQIALLMGEARDVPIPQSWKPIGGWHQQGEDRASDSSVRVFSVRPGLDSDVRMALHSFSEQQHSGVKFWFVDDGSTPSPTRPASVQLSESGEPQNVRAS